VNSSSPSANAVSSFNTLIIDGVADQSSGGRSLSTAELNSLRSTSIPLPSGTDIERFVSLWNKSLDLWDQGTFGGNASSLYFDLDGASALMSNFQASRDAVRQEGYTGLADAWLSAVEGQQFEEARKLAGICAAVKVKIEQELTLTRTGFEARLEVSNNGDHRLENVSVVLRATPFGNASFDATPLFVFGDPALNMISAVDGTGVIDSNRVGSATWLIIPLSEAAPVFETKYDISGILLYSIQGVKYEQYLAPSTISVVPDPQLHLTYFHSRVAYADDPFTSGVVEAAVPFHLGLLIDNRGYGEARNVEMVSSQPEIVENVKGLLVNFTIIGARLGNTPLSKSLKIDFGSIGPRNKALGVWELVSSLRGEFFNFSAKFRYQGPIDDQRLSLIDSVNIYELTHLVRVTGQHPAMPPGGLGYYDDGLDDFLVNRVLDAYYLPDTVFTSDTRGSNYSVGSVRNRGWNETPGENLVNGDVSVVIRHNLTGSERSLLPDWVYVRFDDPMARTDYVLQSVTRPDVDYTLIPQYNSWQTTWTTYLLDGSIINEDLVHLFDFGVSDRYVLLYKKQQPVTGLQVIARSNHSLTVAWIPAAGGTASYVLYKPSSLTSDSYFKVAEEFLQINSCEISGLASGTEYTIQVFTGAGSGKFEQTGARVTGATMGRSTCGDAVVDSGEQCDDGLSNGSPTSNCTVACYVKASGPLPTRAPSSNPTPKRATKAPTKPPVTHAPTKAPLAKPTKAPTKRPVTRIPTRAPLATPTKAPTKRPVTRGPTTAPVAKPTKAPTKSPVTRKPTKAPLAKPTKAPTTRTPTRKPTRFPTKPPSIVTKAPTKRPVTRIPTRPPTRKPILPPQCRKSAQSCNSSNKCCQGLACRASSAGALRCVACQALGKACGTTPCCDGLKCHSTKRLCVTCKARGVTCTSSAQCCLGLGCSTTTKKCT
jgi:Fibronectin type III domain